MHLIIRIRSDYLYKSIVFFDLDGTLLLNDKSLSADTIHAVRELRQNNILPVIATGRNLFEVQYVLKACGIDAIVSANGSYVQYAGKPLHAEYIPQNLITRFNTFAKKRGDAVAWFNSRAFGLDGRNEYTDENFRLLHLLPDVNQRWYQQNPVNFMFVFNFNHEKIYQQKFAGELSLVRNNPRGLDTMLAGVSKKTGIRYLLDKAQLTGIPTFGFGDQLNDLQMFDMVDHAICMGNGNPEAMRRAEYVTSSNMTGGILQGLRHYGLIR
jgi:Cof subfamily protein (haloacid dehalogenase superfamily)